MFSNMLIRKKILYSTLLLTFTLLLLMYCSLRGVYAYRDLTKSIVGLSAQVRSIWDLRQQVNHLRSHTRPRLHYGQASDVGHSGIDESSRFQFREDLKWLMQDLDRHEAKIRAEDSPPDRP